MPEQLWLTLFAIFMAFPVLMIVLGTTDVPEGTAGHALRRLGVLSHAVDGCARAAPASRSPDDYFRAL